MGRKPQSSPSFFKVMSNDFTLHLRIPPMFVKKYGEILPENAKLRTSSGKTWNVELEQLDEKTYCFSCGWTKFAEDVGLKMGEFLVFWFNVGKSTFDVSVYDRSACERQIAGCASRVDVSYSDDDIELINDNDPEVKTNQSSENGDDDKQVYDHTSEEAHPQLVLRLKEHYRSRVFVSKNFAVAAGLMTEKAVVLQYPPDQRCWPVLLVRYPNYSRFRLEMGGGWSEFRSKNGLVFGKTYLLEYVRDKNVIEVKLLSTAN